MELKIRKAIDVKLNVRPVTISLYHNYVFEGPCRFEKGERLKKEYDLIVNAKGHENFIEEIQALLPEEEVNLLSPLHIQQDESFIINEDHLAELARDIHNVDLYLFNVMSVSDLLLEFAYRYKRPMVVMHPILNTGTTAAMLARGIEIHPCETLADAVELMKILRVRKALAETKVLMFNRLNSTNAPGMIDSFISLDEVTAKLGTRFRYFNIHEFMDQTHNVPCDTNSTTPGRHETNITDEDEAEIKKMTDEFMDGAIECHMKPEDIFPSMRAHYLINKLLSKLDCNAFTAPCFDICATRRFNEERFTFCLNHSMNNEKGISSACEYDVCALLSMVVLSNFAKAPAYMGNTVPNPLKLGVMSSAKDIDPDLIDMENLVLTFHAVPNRKLKGYNMKDAPYSIRSFAHSGWGATIRYDFARDKGQKITMCRLDPSCKKIFVAEGTIVGGTGYNNVNCTEGVFFQVKDSRDFFQKISQVGNHIPLVYGEYFNEVKKLGKVLGLEVIAA